MTFLTDLLVRVGLPAPMSQQQFLARAVELAMVPAFFHHLLNLIFGTCGFSIINHFGALGTLCTLFGFDFDPPKGLLGNFIFSKILSYYLLVWRIIYSLKNVSAWLT